MVTKQQQLEWLVKHFDFDLQHINYVIMSGTKAGLIIGSGTSTAHESSALSTRRYIVTSEEWQQERDKMSGKPEVDNSWHERGELPPVGIPVELWFGGSFAYNCEFIVMRGNAYVVWNLDDDKPDCADYMNSQFRPLRTEREKAIDELVGIIKGAAFQDPEFIASILYDAGFRMVKP